MDSHFHIPQPSLSIPPEESPTQESHVSSFIRKGETRLTSSSSYGTDQGCFCFFYLDYTTFSSEQRNVLNILLEIGELGQIWRHHWCSARAGAVRIAFSLDMSHASGCNSCKCATTNSYTCFQTGPRCGRMQQLQMFKCCSSDGLSTRPNDSADRGVLKLDARKQGRCTGD